MSICHIAKCRTVHKEGGSAISAEISDRREDQKRTFLLTVYVDSNTFILLQTAVGEVSSEYQPHTDLANHV